LSVANKSASAAVADLIESLINVTRIILQGRVSPAAAVMLAQERLGSHEVRAGTDYGLPGEVET
jgi:hypothetical protein